jgi:hypothetical protein
MAQESVTKAKALRTQIQEKIQKTLTEFSEGVISREQFHAIYERYTSQLAILEMALRSNVPEALIGIATDGQSTIAVKEAHMGKAVGMVIYNNRTGTLLETLGDFDVPPTKLAPILNDFSTLMQGGKLVEREVRKISARQWLLFAAGEFTTVVTLFHNEPSEMQMKEIERLHRDFERANSSLFRKGTMDADKLAYPFLVFVQQKMKRG